MAQLSAGLHTSRWVCCVDTPSARARTSPQWMCAHHKLFTFICGLPSQPTCVCRGANALLSTEVPSLYTPNQALRLCIPPTHPCLCSPFSFLWLKKPHFSPVPSHIDPWQLPTLGGGSLVRTRMRGEMGSREWILDSGSVKNTPPFL